MAILPNELNKNERLSNEGLLIYLSQIRDAINEIGYRMDELEERITKSEEE